MGDAKDPVRKGVRGLFRDICSMYPPVKMFTFVLEGLKSKNARQRTGVVCKMSDLMAFELQPLDGAKIDVLIECEATSLEKCTNDHFNWWWNISKLIT